MTEAEWLTCEDLRSMLDALKGGNKSDRKLRLFSCACYRRVPDCWVNRETRSVIEATERYADAPLGSEELAEVSMNSGGPYRARFWITRPSAMSAAYSALRPFLDDELSQSQAVELLRDIFGNPFRPVAFSPEWRTDTVLGLAAAMYESRDFSAMPILADALQDAGCDSDDILNHCRDPQQSHARGCWMVDLVLGKE